PELVTPRQIYELPPSLDPGDHNVDRPERLIWVGPSPSVPTGQTSAMGATSPFPCAPEKVPSRSDLPTFVKSIAGRQFVEFTTYALASRLIASWMEARVTKVTKVSARFSKSLARRRLRPNQEEVCSTTQRRGRTTKPFVSSLRLTISRRSSGPLPPQLQLAGRFIRHQPRSVRAKGSAGVSC